MRIQYGMNTGQVQVFLFARQMLIRNDHIYNTFIRAIPAGEQTKKSRVIVLVATILNTIISQV